jgi:hypothetical protein
VAPLFWEMPDAQGRVRPTNATMFFLDGGLGPFAVTANHVYQGFLRAKAENPHSFCRLADMPFDPEARLIAQTRDRAVIPDIATFRVTADEVRALGKEVLGGVQAVWPPAPPEEGAQVFFAGYPGRDRDERTPDAVDFAIFSGFVVAASVGLRDIRCEIVAEPPMDAPWRLSAPPAHGFGGVSGAPLLSVVEHGSAARWRLRGVIYKAVVGGNALYAGRADFIQPDGTLRR